MTLQHKRQPWEMIAVDHIYKGKEPVTVALLPCDHPDLPGWVQNHMMTAREDEHFFIWTYYVTIH